MYGVVNQLTSLSHHFQTAGDAALLQLRVDATSEAEVHPTLAAKQTGFHAQQVVVLRLLEVGIAATQQKLAHFQVVVGVVFVGNGHRQEVGTQHISAGISFGREAHHFDEAFLGEVVAILGATFALGNPHRFAAAVDGIVDIGREMAGGFEGVDQAHVALDYETAVKLHQVGYPIVYQQVIADSHLRQRHLAADEAEVEERGIQHDIAVVGNKGVALPRLQIFQAVATEAGGGGTDQHLQKRAHHIVLKVNLILDFQQVIHKFGIIDTRHYKTHSMLKSRLAYQRCNLLLIHIIIVWRYILKFFRYA